MLLCCCKPPARTRHRNSVSIFFSYDIESVTFGGDFIFVQRHDGNITGCWIPPNKLYLDAVGVLREINNNNSLFLTFNQKVSSLFFSLLAFLVRTYIRTSQMWPIHCLPPSLAVYPSISLLPSLYIHDDAEVTTAADEFHVATTPGKSNGNHNRKEERIERAACYTHVYKLR